MAIWKVLSFAVIAHFCVVTDGLVWSIQIARSCSSCRETVRELIASFFSVAVGGATSRCVVCAPSVGDVSSGTGVDDAAWSVGDGGGVIVLGTGIGSSSDPRSCSAP